MVLLQTVIKKAFIKVQNIRVRNDIVVRMSVVRSAILVLAGLPLIIMLGVFMLPRNMDTALAQSMDTTEKIQFHRSGCASRKSLHNIRNIVIVLRRWNSERILQKTALQ